MAYFAGARCEILHNEDVRHAVLYDDGRANPGEVIVTEYIAEVPRILPIGHREVGR
jgi:hypothetical protein